jgi:hypothetical protein
MDIFFNQVFISNKFAYLSSGMKSDSLSFGKFSRYPYFSVTMLYNDFTP